MKNKPYRITAGSWSPNHAALIVMARPIVIDGWEELNLIIHQHPKSDADWHVSDSDTGALIGVGYTRNGAIKDAASRLSSKTMKEIRKAQRKFSRQYGKLDKLPLVELHNGVIK